MKDTSIEITAAGRVHMSFWVGGKQGRVSITADLPGDQLQADRLLIDAARALRQARVPVRQATTEAETW